MEFYIYNVGLCIVINFILVTIFEFLAIPYEKQISPNQFELLGKSDKAILSNENLFDKGLYQACSLFNLVFIKQREDKR